MTLVLYDDPHTPMMHQAYLCLHHVRSMEPQVKNGAVDIQRVSGVELLKNSIQDDEGSGAAHASTETHTRL